MSVLIALIILTLIAALAGWAGTLPVSPNNMNCTAFGWTPTGGSLTTLKGVKTVTLQPNPQEISEGSDNDFYDTVAGCVGMAFKVMVETNRQVQWHALTPDAYGALTYTIPDFINGTTAAGGGFSVAVSNAFYVPGDEVNAHRTLGSVSPHFGTYSSDGTTSIVAYTAL